MQSYGTSYSHSRGQIVHTMKIWTGNIPGHPNQLVKFDTDLFIPNQVVQALEDSNNPISL